MPLEQLKLESSNFVYRYRPYQVPMTSDPQIGVVRV